MATVPSARDRAATAAIEGFFAAAWLSWAGSLGTQPSRWLLPAALLGYLLVVLGIITVVRNRKGRSAFSGPETGRRYGIVVGIEFGLAGLGALVLNLTGHGGYTIIWVAFVVGVHFLPLSRVLGDRLLVPLGVLMTAVALVGFGVGLRHRVAGGQLAGIGSGLLLLIFGTLALLGIGHRTDTPASGQAPPPHDG
jgi:hypothetical protein